MGKVISLGERMKRINAKRATKALQLERIVIRQAKQAAFAKEPRKV